MRSTAKESRRVPPRNLNYLYHECQRAPTVKAATSGNLVPVLKSACYFLIRCLMTILIQQNSNKRAKKIPVNSRRVGRKIHTPTATLIVYFAVNTRGNQLIPREEETKSWLTKNGRGDDRTVFAGQIEKYLDGESAAHTVGRDTTQPDYRSRHFDIQRLLYRYLRVSRPCIREAQTIRLSYLNRH